MQTLPRISGGPEAYEFYVEVSLQFICADCGAFIDAGSDIRDGEEDAPIRGPWAPRHAKEAMRLGWYVHPLASDGSLISFCLCPVCATKRGLLVRNEKTA